MPPEREHFGHDFRSHPYSTIGHNWSQTTRLLDNTLATPIVESSNDMEDEVMVFVNQVADQSTKLKDELLKRVTQLADKNDELSRYVVFKNDICAKLNEQIELLEDIQEKESSLLRDRHQLELEKLEHKHEAVQNYNESKYLDRIRELEQKVEDLEHRNACLYDQNSKFRERDQIARDRWRELKDKDEQMQRYWQFLCGDGYLGQKSGLALADIPLEFIRIQIMGLSGVRLKAGGLDAITLRCRSEMRVAFAGQIAVGPASKDLTFRLIETMDPFCNIAEVIAERGRKQREEHTLREAYQLYMYAHSLSNASGGLQVDPVYFLLDKLEKCGPDSRLAMTINWGVEFSWKMRLKALKEDLGKLRSIDDQAAKFGQRWYPKSIEALEKAIKAKRGD